MLTAFARAFKTPDLRKKLLFTLGIIALFRLGRTARAGRRLQRRPDVRRRGEAASGLFGLVNLFSGGALLQLSVFALGIMPYITASIILQLLTVVIPRLEALKKEGQAGTAKITQYTRYLTIGARRAPGHRHRRDCARAGHCSPAAATPTSRPRHLGLPHHHDGHHDDRRHHGDHVAGRADHRPRYRQRHVAS